MLRPNPKYYPNDARHSGKAVLVHSPILLCMLVWQLQKKCIKLALFDSNTGSLILDFDILHIQDILLYLHLTLVAVWDQHVLRKHLRASVYFLYRGGGMLPDAGLCMSVQSRYKIG